MNMIIGTISSVATLILFVFYFLGRIWIMLKTKNLMLEDFDVEDIDHCSDVPEDRGIYYDINGGGEIVTIRSSQPILWLNVIPIKYNDDFEDITKKKDKPIVTHRNLIKRNESICLRIDICDGLPVYKVCFQRFDYIIVSFDIEYNGRNGGVSPTNYKMNHTCKSILYLLFK